MASISVMRWGLPFGIVGLCSALASAPAVARPPLGDPVTLNIGINCQWQQQCIKSQTKAMKRSLKYVKQTQPPLWRLQMCNRNAGRQRLRVDWVGFDNCIRNTVLRPLSAKLMKSTPRLAKVPARSAKPPRRAISRKAPRLTESAPPAPPAAPGERG
jgi:hypothetical protein